MGGQLSWAMATYQGLINTVNIRFRRWPLNAAGVVITGNKSSLGKVGSYVEVVAANVIDAESWLYGAVVSKPNTNTTEEFSVDISTGAAGSEAASSLSLPSGSAVPSGVFGFGREAVTAAGVAPSWPQINFPTWIKIINRPRLSAALMQYLDAAANQSVSVALLTAADVGE